MAHFFIAMNQVPNDDETYNTIQDSTTTAFYVVTVPVNDVFDSYY